MELSVSQENYLKAIYKLEAREGVASNQALSTALDSTPASVTNMLRKLTDTGWVDYAAYQGATLTRDGRSRAVQLVRKHRLWEVFLVEKLHYEWDAVHTLAEELEHVGGVELVNRLDAFLGHPSYDPHGDPIPDEKGHMRSRPDVISSVEAEEGSAFVVCGVRDSSDVFLRHLDKLNIELGKRYTLSERLDFDGSMIWKDEDQARTILSQEVAANILIQPKQ